MKPEDVAQYHERAGRYSKLSAFRAIPGLPDDMQIAHLMNCITGDYTDLTNAFLVDQDVPVAALGLIGLVRSAFQGLLALGFRPDEIRELWAETQQVNMGKVDPNFGLLDDNDKRPYLDEGGMVADPPGYRAPDLSRLVERYRTLRPTKILTL